MAFGLHTAKPTKGLSYSHGKRIFYQEFNWENGFPISKTKPEVGDIDDFLEKIDSSTFQWNCESILIKSPQLIEATPSAKNVGFLAYHEGDNWLIEKPYDLVPEYIAPFEMNKKPKLSDTVKWAACLFLLNARIISEIKSIQKILYLSSVVKKKSLNLDKNIIIRAGKEIDLARIL